MSKAYIQNVNSNSSDGIHSVSPAWNLTFVRWSNRNLSVKDEITPRDFTKDNQLNNFLATRRILVVENDCASVSVSYSKESHTPMMSAMLYGGDINYLTAIAPGDFVIVNMVNSPDKSIELRQRAEAGLPINRFGDGFKGFFKVQSVRRTLAVDPASGVKRLMFSVSAYAFTEFNNVIYFNDLLLTPTDPDNQFLYVTRLTEVVKSYIDENRGGINVQNMIKVLIGATVGDGFNLSGDEKKGLQFTPNSQFFIPSDVGRLLNIPGKNGGLTAADVYTYLLGIQKYISGSSSTPASGLNPQIRSVNGRFFETPNNCRGFGLISVEYFNQVVVWSILKRYANEPINEIYTCFRTDTAGFVMPTFVMRQMPFSSEEYTKESTKFLNLPRWKVSPELITSIDIGRDEAARINYVEIRANSPNISGIAGRFSLSSQVAQKNFVTDILDIRRSGLRPFIRSSEFDELLTERNTSSSPEWAKLFADALFGSHLKLNGTIECQGIQEPIAVGDNFEFDGIVFHIEAVAHSASIAPDGKRFFKTSLQLSHGIDKDSKNQKIFPQMDFTNMQSEQADDYVNSNKTLPGFSDEQAIRGREGQRQGVDTTKEKPFPSNISSEVAAIRKRNKDKK